MTDVVDVYFATLKVLSGGRGGRWGLRRDRPLPGQDVELDPWVTRWEDGRVGPETTNSEMGGRPLLALLGRRFLRLSVPILSPNQSRS